MSEKICSATYNDANVPRSSSVTFATVQIQRGRDVERCEKNKSTVKETWAMVVHIMDHDDGHYGQQQWKYALWNGNMDHGWTS